METYRSRLLAICLGVGILCLAAPVFSQSDTVKLAEKLAKLNAEAMMRNEIFMRGISERVAQLALDALVRPENLATATGRTRIRHGFTAFSTVLDEIDAFERVEQSKLDQAIDEIAEGMTTSDARDLRLGFNRGRAAMNARYAALQRLQREEIQTTLELLKMADQARDGIQLVDGKLIFSDPGAGASFKELISRLSALEQAQARAEMAILDARRRSAQRVQELSSSKERR